MLFILKFTVYEWGWRHNKPEISVGILTLGERRHEM